MNLEKNRFEQPEFRKGFAAVDMRGIFAASPLSAKWIQVNTSYNQKRGTFRGMHFQVEPHAQTKLVKVINGSIIDMIVDIRPDSPTYMKVFDYHLYPGDELIVPKGFAHGFVTLEDHTVVQYLIDYPYTPEADRSTRWTGIKDIRKIIDNLNIGPLMISQKDAEAPFIYETE